MILNNFFEKIYVISLLSATQRRESVDNLSKIFDLNKRMDKRITKSNTRLFGGNNF